MEFLIALLLAGSLAQRLNPDYLAPSKFSFAFVLVFFGDAFFNSYSPEVYWYLVILILSIPLLALLEGSLHQSKFQPREKSAFSDRPLWILTLISLFSMLMFVHHFGDLQNFLMSVKPRSRDWAGLGPVAIPATWLLTLNLVYFVQNLMNSKPCWILYATHLLLTLMIGFLLGSRSSLILFVGILVAIHYLRSPVQFTAIVLVASLLVISSYALGGLRVSQSLNPRNWQIGSLRAGPLPLDLLYKRKLESIHFGSTYSTAITQLVPRRLWSSKPETGGVRLTREYAGTAYGQTNSFTPGIFGEAILNFGYFNGPLAGLAMWLTVLLLVSFSYQNIRQKLASTDLTPQSFALYFFGFQALLGLLVGDFGQTAASFISKTLVPIILLAGLEQLMLRRPQ